MNSDGFGFGLKEYPKKELDMEMFICVMNYLNAQNITFAVSASYPASDTGLSTVITNDVCEVQKYMKSPTREKLMEDLAKFDIPYRENMEKIEFKPSTEPWSSLDSFRFIFITGTTSLSAESRHLIVCDNKPTSVGELIDEVLLEPSLHL